MHSIETANVLLCLLGITLTISGPYILYRTVIGVRARRLEDPKAGLQIFSNFLNLIIAVLFLMGGILFIVNNLKGNPLE